MAGFGFHFGLRLNLALRVAWPGCISVVLLDSVFSFLRKSTFGCVIFMYQSRRPRSRIIVFELFELWSSQCVMTLIAIRLGAVFVFHE